MQQSNLTQNSRNQYATSALAQATEGTKHVDKEEERSFTEDETDELVEIVTSSSASRSVREKITSDASPLPMEPPRRLFPSDQTGRLDNAVLRSGQLPAYGLKMASTSAQVERHGDTEGSSAGRRKRLKISNARPIHIGEEFGAC